MPTQFRSVWNQKTQPYSFIVGRDLLFAKAIATQAHLRNEDTIIAAQQPVKRMRAPLSRRKGPPNACRRLQGPILRRGREEDAATSRGIPCIAGEFRSTLYMLFQNLDETQPWFAQLPNQLKVRAVKGQVGSAGLFEMAQR